MKSEQLKRTIGLVSATSIGLGAMLGAGIFVFPGLAGGQAGLGAVLSFLIGGVIALLVAVCTAELATAMPQSGGGYFFISRSFGEFWGAVVGISQWIGLIFACAFYLVSFGEYALTFLDELHISWVKSDKVLSFCFTLILLCINIIGTKKVGYFQNLIVISLTIILVLIFTYGLIDFLGFENQSTALSENKPQGLGSILTTTALIFTSYLGFVQIANVGGEIKQPSKNLPRSLIWSVILAMALYAFIMIVCFIPFSQEELKNFGETATVEVARRLLGKWGAVVVVFAALLAALSSANASLISASRGVFALSKDQLITERASKINDRFSTPHIALVLVALPVAAMLIQSNLKVFAEVASFLHLIIYAGICLSVLKLRIENPFWYVPTFRLPAAKFIAVVGAIACLMVIPFMQKMSIQIGSGVLLMTMIYYFLFVRKKQIVLSAPSPPHINRDLLNPHVLIPVDISREKKDLPYEVLEAIPISQMLLLGYREIPEQSDPEQIEEKYGEEGKTKLDDIIEALEKTQVSFDTELIFGDDIAAQIRQVIEQKELQFILKLQPIADLHQVVIPIYDLTQVNTELSTIVYRLHSRKSVNIKVLLLTEGEGDSSKVASLKRAIKNQLNLVHIRIHDWEVHSREKAPFYTFIQKNTSTTDLVLWSEPASPQDNLFLNMILEKGSTENTTPVMMILNKRRD